DPAFLGRAHRPFIPFPSQNPTSNGAELDRFRLRGSKERLEQRKELLKVFDTLRQEVDDWQDTFAGVDAHIARALEMITTPKIRDGFDVSREPAAVRDKYGAQTHWLQALRLVEAGASVVTLTSGIDDWDTHGNDNNVDPSGKKYETNFNALRRMLPEFDRAMYALITDLTDRGLDKDVAVVVWGEMGRTPRIDTKPPIICGRDHWPQAGFAVVIGGGLEMGQVIGATNAR